MRPPEPRPPAWSPVIDPWIRRLRAGSMSPVTVKIRSGQLWQLARAHPDPRALTEDDLLVWLARPGRSAEWRRSYTSALRSCMSHAVRTGALPVDVAADLPSVRIHRRPPVPAEVDDIRRALAEVEPRTQVMLHLGAMCGLRRAEIARVHTGRDMRIGTQALTVLGKGDKTRVVPVPDPLWEILIAARAAAGPGGGWLFPSRQGQHLSPHRIYCLVRETGIRTHQLRAAYATGLADAGLGLIDIAHLLGHASVDTTMRYVRPNSDHMVGHTQAFAQRLTRVCG